MDSVKRTGKRKSRDLTILAVANCFGIPVLSLTSEVTLKTIDVLTFLDCKTEIIPFTS